MTWWQSAWSEWQKKQIRPQERKAIFSGFSPGLTVFLASGFLAGFIPRVPGTAGTLVGLACYWLFLCRIPPLGYLFVLLLFVFLGSLLCGKAERYLGKTDAAPIVWDELVGYLASVAFLPSGTWTLWGGFLLFRLFDILKPPPIRRIQSLKGGWGVMADDLIAALYANIVLRLILSLTGGLHVHIRG